MASNDVKIHAMQVQKADGSAEIITIHVSQNGLQHGFFEVRDYPSTVAAEEAAKAFAESLIDNPWVSPFVTHTSAIMGEYGTAAKLRRFVLSLYNGRAFPCDLSDVRGMDRKHFEIFNELVSSYHKLGENDREFIMLADRIKKEFPRNAD